MRHDSNYFSMMMAGVILATGFSTLGCRHRPDNFGGPDSPEHLLPRVTDEVTGVVAPLLPPDRAFTCDFTMTFQNNDQPPLDDRPAHKDRPPLMVSGQILAGHGKIRLDTSLNGPKKKAKPGNNFTVVWDAAAGQGSLASEALQGYALISNPVRSTNLATQVMTEPTDRSEGHPVDHANLTVTFSDGHTSVMQVSRARDLGNLPVAIHFADGPRSVDLVLTKIQPVTPPDDLFLPPEEFTKYATETALLVELASRQTSVMHPGTSGPAPRGDRDEGPGGRPPMER